MSNSRTRPINYKPRLTDMESFDALPSAIREALHHGPTTWDTYWILREYRKLCKTWGPKTSARKMVERIDHWNRLEVKDGKKIWSKHLRKPGKRWDTVPDSPHNQANATMLKR